MINPNDRSNYDSIQVWLLNEFIKPAFKVLAKDAAMYLTMIGMCVVIVYSTR